MASRRSRVKAAAVKAAAVAAWADGNDDEFGRSGRARLAFLPAAQGALGTESRA